MSRSRRKVPVRLARRVRQQACNRCGYCLSSETLIGAAMEIEHLIPHALGGQTIEENLWLSCRRCNEFKGAQTHALDPETAEHFALFDPRQQIWDKHFRWSEDGASVIGIASTGRATVVALRLNHPVIVTTRRLWVSVGWWPPGE